MLILFVKILTGYVSVATIRKHTTTMLQSHYKRITSHQLKKQHNSTGKGTTAYN